MEMSKIALAIISLISLAIVHHAHAQDSPQDFLKAHNTARASVGVGPMIWDNKVAAFARSYINGLRRSCRIVHSGGPYGENLAWGSANLAGTAAVKMWVDERQYYDYDSNSCVGGECKHYTQVVWRKSVRLGCAKVRCNNGGTIISCNYDPPGNFNDEHSGANDSDGGSTDSDAVDEDLMASDTNNDAITGNEVAVAGEAGEITHAEAAADAAVTGDGNVVTAAEAELMNDTSNAAEGIMVSDTSIAEGSLARSSRRLRQKPRWMSDYVCRNDKAVTSFRLNYQKETPSKCSNIYAVYIISYKQPEPYKAVTLEIKLRKFKNQARMIYTHGLNAYPNVLNQLNMLKGLGY
ncbi:hypothetical protein SADUNF_Sadunf16G0171900 [Salix dunnii]|uniref:SCP domain-containing protein n=1 Tax=Salix dunnii TaxID=1413687 RepID=A0A835JES9_9ROSI|nr:hypothetical protein SADUNF_Sadunf16G0171900 [Salix dunnii]